MAVFFFDFSIFPIIFIITRYASLSNVIPTEDAECHLYRTVTIIKLASQKPELWSSHSIPTYPLASLLWQHHAHRIIQLLDSHGPQPGKRQPNIKRIYSGFSIYHDTQPTLSLSKNNGTWIHKIGYKSWKMALFLPIFPYFPIIFIMIWYVGLSNIIPIAGRECYVCKSITISMLTSQKPELWSSHWPPPHPLASPLWQQRHHTHRISPLLDSHGPQPRKNGPNIKHIYPGFSIYQVTQPTLFLYKYSGTRTHKIGFKSWKMALFSAIFLHLPIIFNFTR